MASQEKNQSTKEDTHWKVLSFVLSILTIGLAMPAAAAEPPAKSGTFKTQGGFKAVEEVVQLDDKHTFSHGIAWGVIRAAWWPLSRGHHSVSQTVLVCPSRWRRF